MSDHKTTDHKDDHAAAPAAAPAAHNPTQVRSGGISKAEIMREVAISLGIDGLVFAALPMVKKIFGALKNDASDSQAIAAAKECFKKGEMVKGLDHLHRAAFGIGMDDEQIQDYDFTVARRIYPELEKKGRFTDFERFLAATRRHRDAFRNSNTLDGNWKRRVELIADYAQLNDAGRIQRLTAHGKLDPNAAEEVLHAAEQGVLDVVSTVNSRAQAYLARDRQTWFSRLAQALIK